MKRSSTCIYMKCTAVFVNKIISLKLFWTLWRNLEFIFGNNFLVCRKTSVTSACPRWSEIHAFVLKKHSKCCAGTQENRRLFRLDVYICLLYFNRYYLLGWEKTNLRVLNWSIIGFDKSTIVLWHIITA